MMLTDHCDLVVWRVARVLVHLFIVYVDLSELRVLRLRGLQIFAAAAIALIRMFVLGWLVDSLLP